MASDAQPKWRRLADQPASLPAAVGDADSSHAAQPWLVAYGSGGRQSPGGVPEWCHVWPPSSER